MLLSIYVHSRGHSPTLKATSIAIGIYEAIDVRVDSHSALLISCDVVEDILMDVSGIDCICPLERRHVQNCIFKVVANIDPNVQHNTILI